MSSCVLILMAIHVLLLLFEILNLETSECRASPFQNDLDCSRIALIYIDRSVQLWETDILAAGDDRIGQIFKNYRRVRAEYLGPISFRISDTVQRQANEVVATTT